MKKLLYLTFLAVGLLGLSTWIIINATRLQAPLIKTKFLQAPLINKNNDWKTEQKLLQNWALSGTKSIATKSKPLHEYILRGKNMLKLTYNLHGLCLLDGDASAIGFQQKEREQKYTISLAQYGKNCYNGEQTVDIPLSHFQGLDTSKPTKALSVTFWYPTHYEVTIQKALVYYSIRAVLGESIPPRTPKRSKEFPNITPIRPLPYAATNSAQPQ